MNHATTDEPIKVKFGVWTRMRPRNDMLVYVMGNTAISAQMPSTGADATMHPDTDRESSGDGGTCHGTIGK